MNWLEIVYIGSAVIGGTLFILRMLTMIVGGMDFGDSDLPTDFDGGFNADIAGDLDGGMEFDDLVDHPSSDISFKFLSLQGLTAFFMMFGVIGLALHRANLWAVVSITGGTLAGLFTVWLMGIIFAAMLRLQSEGTLNIRNAIGQQGTVYLTIPKEGSGQVSVVVQGSLKVFDAVAENKQKIPTGDKIKVVGIVDNQTLIVTKLTE